MSQPMLDLLSQDNIIELTGYQRSSEQARILRQHGIFYIERKDGTLAVTLHAVHNPTAWKPEPKSSRINLEAI